MKEEELFKGLTDEQIAKIKACKTTEEVLQFVKDEGIELTDEQLQVVSGGCGTYDGSQVCPKCGARGADLKKAVAILSYRHALECSKCHYFWEY